MASTRELRDSRIGGTTDQPGLVKILVSLGSASENPRAVAANDYPIGSPYPGDWHPGATCSDHRVYACLNPLNYIVEVLYVSSVFFIPSGLGWTIEDQQTLSGSEQIETTVPSPGTVPKFFGSPKYEPSSGGAYSAYDSVRGREITLRLDGRAARSPEPETRQRTTSQLNIFRIVPNDPNPRYGQALGFRDTVNSSTIFGAAPGQLLFSGGYVRREAGELVGQQQPGIVWRVGLSLVWDGAGHSPIRRYHKYRDDQGNVSLVYAGGQPVVEEFEKYPRAEFGTLLGLFDR